MSEVFEHNPSDHEDPLTGPTWIVAFLGAVLLIVITLGLTALFYNAQAQEEHQKLIMRDPMELGNLQARQREQLTGTPRWVEQQIDVEGSTPQLTRSLVIPIERAMELVAAEQRQPTATQPRTR
jgi:hypothetical protein